MSSDGTNCYSFFNLLVFKSSGSWKIEDGVHNRAMRREPLVMGASTLARCSSITEPPLMKWVGVTQWQSWSWGIRRQFKEAVFSMQLNSYCHQLSLAFIIITCYSKRPWPIKKFAVSESHWQWHNGPYLLQKNNFFPFFLQKKRYVHFFFELSGFNFHHRDW